MKSTVLLASFLCVTLAATTSVAATKVFLLAGQSNMDGRGAPALIPLQYQPPQAGVKVWDGRLGTDSGWKNPGETSGSRFGPEVSFGYTLRQSVSPDDDIYLVKYSVGSTNLHHDWKPDGSGARYNTFKTTVQNALANLTTANLSPTIAGMIWMQGESDAYDHTCAPHYEDNLRTFIDTVRDDFSEYSIPNMPFVIGRLSPLWKTADHPEDNAMVRNAQVAVGDDPTLINVSWIDTDNLTVVSSSDRHYDTQGQIDLGVLFASEIISTPESSSLGTICTGRLALQDIGGRRRINVLSRLEFNDRPGKDRQERGRIRCRRTSPPVWAGRYRTDNAKERMKCQETATR